MGDRKTGVENAKVTNENARKPPKLRATGGEEHRSRKKSGVGRGPLVGTFWGYALTPPGVFKGKDKGPPIQKKLTFTKKKKDGAMFG